VTTKTTPPGPLARASSAQAARDDAADLVELWGVDSFPASDPPANW
jgi:hypothetical protein